MFSNLYAWAAVLSLAIANAQSTPGSTPVGSLYAYGKGISGLPLIYSDGLLLLGWGQPASADVATNLTFTNVKTTLIASPNNTALASNWTSNLLYINTNKGQLADIGLTGYSNSSLTTTGFDFWGRQLLWLGTNENAGAGRSFWASPTEDDSDFYKVFWNADNIAVEGGVPVTIKRLPPPSIPSDD